MDPSHKSKNVSVVIPVYNQSHLTRRCLDSLYSNSLDLKEIFVVNNASKDDTPEVLASFAGRPGPRLEVIHNSENSGFGRAVNQGLRKCTGDHLVVLNNDTWLMPGWDRALSGSTGSSPPFSKDSRKSLDVVIPYFYEKPFSDDIPRIAEEFVRRNQGRIRHHFAAILFMITRSAFERLKLPHGGLFDERFFVTYEDTDLLRRMRDLGVTYGQTGSCFIWHHSMASRSAPGALPPWYEQEGLKLFIEKWGYDPRPAEHTLTARLRRRWWKIKDKYGRF